MSKTQHHGDALDDILARKETDYIRRHPQSKKHHELAVSSMPGGNTRSVLFNKPFPITMERGIGNKLVDCDGNNYYDFVCEFTAGLYGHSHPVIRAAIISTFDEVGVNLGATNVHETKLASLICSRFSSIEKVRFCNSGTEANLYAFSIARHVTQLRKIIVFHGGYHGGVFYFGHGIAANTVDAGDWILGTYNDVSGTRELIEETEGVAAVCVEAMQGSGGCIPATQEFLDTIQTCCEAHGIIFILDEVMTSRLHPGGLQAKFSLKPDLTTLGKYIGGGLAFGAFGGREDLLASYDPRNPNSLPHSGTFNNNTLTMAAGYAGLSQIYTNVANRELNMLGDELREALVRVAKGTKMVITGVGAILTVHFLSEGIVPVNASDIDRQSSPRLKRLFWFYCLENGYWVTERGMLALCLGTTEVDIIPFVALVERFLSEFRDHLRLEDRDCFR